MAGTLTISTLSDGTNSTSSTNCIQGSAKAWANINTATATINSSYNISSITVPATGYVVFNFTNAFANTNYGAVGTAKGIPATNQGLFAQDHDSSYSAKTTSAFPAYIFARGTGSGIASTDVSAVFYSL